MADAPSSVWSRGEIEAGVPIADLLVRSELASSKGEARRFLEQGGVYVNNQRVDDGATVGVESLLHNRYLVVRRGRKSLHLVTVSS